MQVSINDMARQQIRFQRIKSGHVESWNHIALNARSFI